MGVPPTIATKLQYHLRKAQISLLPQATISRTLCVHITLLAITAPPFELPACVRSTPTQADNLVTIYIISFPGDVSTSLNMTIGCGCSHPCHSERKRGNPADRRTHQADNLAKLRQEFLSLLELIAKIFCAVEIAKTSAVSGNRHCGFVSI